MFSSGFEHIIFCCLSSGADPGICAREPVPPPPFPFLSFLVFLPFPLSLPCHTPLEVDPLESAIALEVCGSAVNCPSGGPERIAGRKRIRCTL